MKTTSDCYGNARNLSLSCKFPYNINVQQVSLGVSRNQKCLIPSPDFVHPGCCTPSCGDCLFPVQSLTNSAKRNCQGRSDCNTQTDWKRVGYDSSSKCAGKLTNYMTIVYSCLQKGAPVTFIPDKKLTENIICDNTIVKKTNTDTHRTTRPRIAPRPTITPVFATTTELTSKKAAFLSTTNIRRPSTSSYSIHFRSSQKAATLDPSADVRNVSRNHPTPLDTSHLSAMARSEAVIFGSTAAAAVLILLVGMVIGWSFCRRKYKPRKSDLLSNYGLPLYSYPGDGMMPMHSSYHYDSMPSCIAGISSTHALQACPSMIKPFYHCQGSCQVLPDILTGESMAFRNKGFRSTPMESYDFAQRESAIGATSTETIESTSPEKSTTNSDSSNSKKATENRHQGQFRPYVCMNEQGSASA